MASTVKNPVDHSQMRLSTSTVLYPLLCLRHWCALLVCGLIVQGYPGCSTVEAAHGVSGAAPICHGFVVLPNGFAVLSGMPAVPERLPAEPPSASLSSHTAEAAPREPAPPQTTAASAHLMHYQHGEDIAPQEGMVCVAVDSQEAVTWIATSLMPDRRIQVASPSGPLVVHRPQPASLLLTIRQHNGAPIAKAQAHVRGRMPHHDQHLPGGHGLANDPDGHGLHTQPDGPGRYMTPPLVFTESGLWLIEIQVNEGNKVYNAYLGVAIGDH